MLRTCKDLRSKACERSRLTITEIAACRRRNTGPLPVPSRSTILPRRLATSSWAVFHCEFVLRARARQASAFLLIFDLASSQLPHFRTCRCPSLLYLLQHSCCQSLLSRGSLCSTNSAAFQVTLNKFTFASFLETIQRWKVTTLYVVPPIVVQMVSSLCTISLRRSTQFCLLQVKSALTSQYDLSSLRVGLVGAAPLTQEVRRLLSIDALVGSAMPHELGGGMRAAHRHVPQVTRSTLTLFADHYSCEGQVPWRSVRAGLRHYGDSHQYAPAVVVDHIR